jgi:hypothetical protein
MEDAGSWDCPQPCRFFSHSVDCLSGMYGDVTLCVMCGGMVPLACFSSAAITMSIYSNSTRTCNI